MPFEKYFGKKTKFLVITIATLILWIIFLTGGLSGIFSLLKPHDYGISCPDWPNCPSRTTEYDDYSRAFGLILWFSFPVALGIEILIWIIWGFIFLTKYIKSKHKQ